MKRITAVFFIISCHAVNGQYKTAISNAERFIDSLQIKQDIPGISVCMGSKEKILWSEGFGFADLENKTRVTVNPRFFFNPLETAIR